MSFDVLARDLQVNQHILCEASAGTGKTFTIEHLFVRRLITSPKCSVKNIAVLTFTNAVAGELVLRLKRALEKAIEDLRTKNEKAPDYIFAIIEQGHQNEVANELEVARDEIEFAAIDTIHGFCFRCLSEYVTGILNGDKGKFATGADVSFCIEEFFRSGLASTVATHAELKVLLKKHRSDFAVLLEKLSEALWAEKAACVGAVTELAKSLQNIQCPWGPDELLAKLEEASHHFKGIRSKDGELKEGVFESMQALKLFVEHPKSDIALKGLIENPLFASELFSDPKAKSLGMEIPVLAYVREIEPLLMELAHPDAVFERMRESCKKFVEVELERRGLYCVEELLLRMEKKLSDPAFCAYVKERFSCVIVDEFQDTDLHQWNIIQTLFVKNWPGVLYLVGDPKQAIYSFRKADVYCYMQAKVLENQAVVTLSKNFRSSPDLVSALNTLFCGPHTPSLFVLPKLKTSLDVPLISSGEKAENLCSEDVGAIHFFQAATTLGKKRNWPTEELEKGCYYPYIAHEIMSLKEQGLAFSSIAVLIKDRYQADKLATYLASRGVPCYCWKKRSVIESEAHNFLQRLCACVANSKDRTALIDLMIQKPFAYSSQQCVRLREDLLFWAEHVTHLHELKQGFDEAQVAGLVTTLLQSVWPESAMTMKEAVWNDKEFLFDLESLVELCLDHCQTLEALQEYLQALKRFVKKEKEQLTSHYDPHEEAVQILTLHASKGLEFDAVFALGVANRSKNPDVKEDVVERDAEKLRLFYVACTRAKQRLYLPVAYELEAKETPVGTASPMELFLQTIDDEAPVQWLVDQSKGKITASTLVPMHDMTALQTASDKIAPPLLLSPLAYKANTFQLTSFTRLNDRSLHTTKAKVQTELPAGIEAGIVLHELLQELLQNKIEPDSNFLKMRLAATVFEGFEAELLPLLHSALGVTLGGFCLKDVKRLACEVPFYLKEASGRYIQGVIDLFFEHNGKFYLLDWKSNLLESYLKADLQQEIETQGYALQAKMYSDACLCHLRKQREHFGGFYFVFLRGVEKDQGVMFLDPTGDLAYV